jgi:hypothetical protein
MVAEKILFGFHEGGAEFVEPRHFGWGESAIVDADVVDGAVERIPGAAISTAAAQKAARYCDCCGTERVDGRWPLTWE